MNQKHKQPDGLLSISRLKVTDLISIPKIKVKVKGLEMDSHEKDYLDKEAYRVRKSSGLTIAKRCDNRKVQRNE